MKTLANAQTTAPGTTPPVSAMTSSQQQPGQGRGNAAAQEALAAQQAKPAATYEPIVAGTVVEARPDADALVNLVGALYSSGTRDESKTSPMRQLMQGKFVDFDGTGMGSMLAEAAANGRFSGQPYFDMGWLNAGTPNSSSGDPAMLGITTGVCQVRCTVRAMAGNFEPSTSGKGTASASSGASVGRTREQGVSAGIGLEQGGLGMTAGNSASDSVAHGTQGSAQLSMGELPMRAREGDMAFEVMMEFKQFGGAPPKRSGTVRAGRVIIMTAMADSP